MNVCGSPGILPPLYAAGDADDTIVDGGTIDGVEIHALPEHQASHDETTSNRVKCIPDYRRRFYSYLRTRKGPAMHVTTTNTMDPPPMPSVLLRGEWSLGEKFWIYWKWPKQQLSWLLGTNWRRSRKGANANKSEQWWSVSTWSNNIQRENLRVSDVTYVCLHVYIHHVYDMMFRRHTCICLVLESNVI